MPVDHRRINGPENSEPYQIYLNKPKKIIYSNIRSDSRKSQELRKIYVKTGVVTQAKGSAYIELNKTKVIVSVFDPREIPNKNDYTANGELYCEFKFASFSCPRRRMHQQDSEEKEYSVIMKRALESAVCRHEFPNFQVDIYALVLENDGSALSAAITCAGLALAHAGVPMYDLVTAVTLGRQRNDIFMDPTLSEEAICMTDLSTDNQTQNEHGLMVLSILSTHQQISELYQTGCFSLETITRNIDLLMNANKQIVPLIQKCLVSFVIRHVKDKKLMNDEENNEIIIK